MNHYQQQLTQEDVGSGQYRRDVGLGDDGFPEKTTADQKKTLRRKVAPFPESMGARLASHPPVPWKKRYINHKSESGPVSVIVCIQEGAILHFYGTDEALGPDGRPIHPSSRPSVDIHLKLNQLRM